MHSERNRFQCIVFALLVCIALPASAQTDRIQFTPSAVSLLPGDSVVVSVELAEPIIAPSGSSLPFVELMLVSPDSDIVIAPATLQWEGGDWSVAQTFTVQRVRPSKDLTDRSLFNFISANSNSEFYDGYSPSFAVDLVAPVSVPTLPVFFLVMLSIFTCVAARRFWGKSRHKFAPY